VGHLGVVLNASSGSGTAEKAADRLKVMLAEAGVEARLTLARSGAELSSAMRREVDAGCNGLVVGGGDGTISTGAQAVLQRGIPLGVLPLGTLNHFAKDLGIPLDLEEAAGVVLEGVVCKVDVGEVNGRLFLNNSSLGVYPAIVRLRERYQASGTSKWIAALWAALAVLRRNPFMAVRIIADGQTTVRRTPFVFIGNNEYRMVGLNPAARESLANQHLALYVLNADRRVGLLRLAMQVVVKGADDAKELDLITVQAASIETKRRRLQVALDGEVVSLESPLEYRVRPGALRVYVPADASACYPHPFG
jgi:diacylglycerol kinase family enzyme